MHRLKSPYVLVPLTVLLLLAGWFAWQLFGPTPAIIVSRETTYITAPLRPDGLPDYEAYLLEKMRAGVTPENNAAVLLWQALGPIDMSQEEFEAVCREIGLETLPAPDACAVEVSKATWERRLKQWLVEVGVLPPLDLDKPYDPETDHLPDSPSMIVARLTEQFAERPWTRRQVPPLGDWLDQYGSAIDLLVEGSQRPRFYSPPPAFLNDVPDSLLSLLHPQIAARRDAVRILATRAMGHLGDGHHEQAWEDILAIYRWSLLTNQGEGLIELLTSYTILGIAQAPTLALFDTDELTEEYARKILRDLNTLSTEQILIAQAIEDGERVHGLSMIIDELLLKENSDAMLFGMRVAFDWNVILRRKNEFQDKLGEAARIPKWSRRQQTLEQIVVDSESKLKGKAFRPLFSTRRVRSQFIADVFLALLTPSVKNVVAAETRTCTQLDLVQLAAALMVYRAVHGEYPDRLDELVPTMLDALPVDLYSGKPFVYRLTSNGYLLYSCGPNGIDDGGNHFEWGVFKGYPFGISPENVLRQLLAEDLPSEEDEIELAEVAGDEQADMEGSALTATEQLLSRNIPADADDIAIRMPRPKLVLPEKR